MRRLLPFVVALVALVAPVTLGGAAGLLLRAAGLFLGARGLGRLELRCDERVVLRAQIDLVVEVLGRAAPGRARRSQVVVLLERLDLLDRDLELVGDPRVGAPLADPGTDLVELRA